MINLEALGALAGGIVVGGVAAITFIGKIVNQQVTKSFEHSINGDGEESLGLRTSLKELRADVKVISDKVGLIEQNQALIKQSLEYRDERCDNKHAALDKAIERLEAR